MAPRKKAAVVFSKKNKEKETSNDGIQGLNHTTRFKPHKGQPGRPRQPKQAPKQLKGTIYRKAKKYHTLKREVMAPFFIALALENRFEEFIRDLDDEGSTAESFPEDVIADLNDTSYQDDWRSG